MAETTASRITTIRWVYLIITLFVALILGLVLFFHFQMDAAVAMRAFVGGEGLWAKAQKEAVRSIEHYALSHDAADYLAYRRQIQVPLGDRRARIELQKENPDLAVARAGLLQGRIPPKDIEYIIPFFRRFQHTAYMSEVIRHWAAGDSLIAEFNAVAEALHAEIASGRNRPEALRSYIAELDDINRRVTVEEDLFSATLAEASRWANDVSHNLTYGIALLFVALGVGLSQPIIRRIRRTENALLAAQEELLRSEKLTLLGQVADTVGHELRNPLGVMNNAVYFLQTVLADADDTTKEYLGIIKDEIADAERIVSDLLDAVRTKPPHPEIVELATLIQEALRKCEVPPSVTVRLEIPETISTLLVDPAQMHQVFWNLISNGVEAMPDGGALEIRASEDRAAHTVTVAIKDSGCGIAPADQAKLFQPMFTTKARRVGLGLTVVKNLTLANGGSVGMESALGTGSTFFVTLPSG